MKVSYYAETDSLYIELSERPSSESLEVAPGVVIDLDDEGRVVGIDVDHASAVLDLSRLETKSFPVGQA
jgi:uncharacterized protein YuzE